MCFECHPTEENKGLKQNCDVKANTPHRIGFLAQDFKEAGGGVYASIVSKLGVPSEEDKKMFDFTDDDQLYGLQYSKVTPILMAMLKGAKTKITALEAQLATMDDRLKALESP